LRIFHFQILYFFLKQAQKLVNKAFQKNIQFYDIDLGAGLIEKLCYNLHCFFIKKWLNILIYYAFFEFVQQLSMLFWFHPRFPLLNSNSSAQ